MAEVREIERHRFGASCRTEAWLQDLVHWKVGISPLRNDSVGLLCTKYGAVPCIVVRFRLLVFPSVIASNVVIVLQMVSGTRGLPHRVRVSEFSRYILKSALVSASDFSVDGLFICGKHLYEFEFK